MVRAKSFLKPTPTNLASLIRGLYGRVARKIKVDPSYVSRVARGERQSHSIEVALEKELRHIMALVKSTHNGAGHRPAKRPKGKSKKIKKKLV